MRVWKLEDLPGRLPGFLKYWFGIWQQVQYCLWPMGFFEKTAWSYMQSDFKAMATCMWDISVLGNTKHHLNFRTAWGLRISSTDRATWLVNRLLYESLKNGRFSAKVGKGGPFVLFEPVISQSDCRKAGPYELPFVKPEPGCMCSPGQAVLQYRW